MFQHVLVIDSSPTDIQDIKQKLLEVGVEKITFAGRTGIGLEELRTKHKVPFGCIIMDIHQPDTGDIDSVLKVRGEKQAIKLPLVVLCNEMDPVFMFLALSVGADEYVTKKVFTSSKIENILFFAQERRGIRIEKYQDKLEQRRMRLMLR